MPEQNRPEGPVLGKPGMIGLIAVLCFFGLFFAWAIFAPLSSAAIAMGELSVEGNRKTIAHLEGGIVIGVDVHEGDKVKAGQLLLRLEQTHPEATLALVKDRYLAAEIQSTRLKTERDGLATLEYPVEILQRMDEAEVQEMIATQQSIFEARQNSVNKRKQIFLRRIEQYRAEIQGLKDEIETQSNHLALIAEEVNALTGLIKRGMASKAKNLQLKKEAAQIEGAKARNKAAVARVEQNIAESELEINRLDTERLNEVVQELSDTQSQIYELKEKMRAAQNVLDRTEIRAPIDGTVVNLKTHTLGGIIGPGEALLEIVPSHDRLIVEARIKPDDIDVVKPALVAYIRFTAFSSVTQVPVTGKVLTVSADRLIDERTGEPFYSAKLELTEALPKPLTLEQLYPGMQAEVMIMTGLRTPLDYLLTPLAERVRRAFREN